MSNARFLCSWSDGYAKPDTKLVGAEFFVEDNGYEPEMIQGVSGLAVGAKLDLSDPSGVHVVERVS